MVSQGNDRPYEWLNDPREADLSFPNFLNDLYDDMPSISPLWSLDAFSGLDWHNNYGLNVDVSLPTMLGQLPVDGRHASTRLHSLGAAAEYPIASTAALLSTEPSLLGGSIQPPDRSNWFAGAVEGTSRMPMTLPNAQTFPGYPLQTKSPQSWRISLYFPVPVPPPPPERSLKLVRSKLWMPLVGSVESSAGDDQLADKDSPEMATDYDSDFDESAADERQPPVDYAQRCSSANRWCTADKANQCQTNGVEKNVDRPTMTGGEKLPSAVDVFAECWNMPVEKSVRAGQFSLPVDHDKKDDEASDDGEMSESESDDSESEPLDSSK